MTQIGLRYYIGATLLMTILTAFSVELEGLVECVMQRDLDLHVILIFLNVVILLFIPTVGYVFYFIDRYLIINCPFREVPPKVMWLHPQDYWLLQQRFDRRNG